MGVSLLLENTSQDFIFSLYLNESWFLPLLLVAVLAALPLLTMVVPAILLHPITVALVALLLLMVVPAILLLLMEVPVALPLPLAVLDAPSKVFPA